MNDLEICKRIAEIEGKEFYLLESGEDTYPMIKVWSDSVLKDKCVPKRFFESHDYNPLTDDALCFQLMVKYRINFETITCNDGEFVCYDFLWPDGQFYKSLQNDNPNRGICLAIIEAHKEQ